MNQSFMKQCIQQLIRKNKMMTVAFIALLVLAIIFSLVPAQVLRYIIDEMITPQEYDQLFKGAMIYFGVIVLIQIVEMMKETSFVWIGQSLTQTLCNEMMKKITRMKTSYFTSVDPAIISSYFLNDAQTISTVFSSGVIAMVVNCLKIIGIVISIALFSKMLALLLILLLPILFVFTRAIQKKMLKNQIQNRILTSNLTKIINDTVHNARIIKVFHRENYHQDKFEKALDESYQTIENINLYDSLYSPITQIIRAIVIVIIVFMASDYFSFSSFTIGMCAASIELMTQLFDPIESLGMELQAIQQAMSGIQRINAFYKIEEEQYNRRYSYEDVFQSDTIELCFNHVNFEYNQGVPVLQDITMKCSDKQRNVIAGRTGVGKSTLFHLILGFYQPTQGEITLNGIPPHQIKREDTRRIYGLVDQNFRFIEGTIKDQITLKDPQFRDEDVIEVMKLCGLHETVMAFEKGYDTLSQATLFSKGQTQLLSLARALLAQPKILLLDEMSANLDPVTERKIIEVLDRIAQGKLILSITHHTHIIQQEDHVIYLKNGQMVKPFS